MDQIVDILDALILGDHDLLIEAARTIGDVDRFLGDDKTRGPFEAVFREGGIGGERTTLCSKVQHLIDEHQKLVDHRNGWAALIQRGPVGNLYVSEFQNLCFIR